MMVPKSRADVTNPAARVGAFTTATSLSPIAPPPWMSFTGSVVKNFCEVKLYVEVPLALIWWSSPATAASKAARRCCGWGVRVGWDEYALAVHQGCFVDMVAVIGMSGTRNPKVPNTALVLCRDTEGETSLSRRRTTRRYITSAGQLGNGRACMKTLR